MRRLARATGNWVVGDQYWDRERETALFMERLAEGAHLKLTAPRRMGKTSLMKESARRFGDARVCIFVDLESAKTAADAIADLTVASQACQPIWNKARNLFSSLVEQVDVKFNNIGLQIRSGLNSGNWMATGDRLFEILAAHEKPVVVMLDEVPILVNRLLKSADRQSITPAGVADADLFLSWLREISQRYGSASNRRVGLVISGSIGFEPVLAQGGMSATMNTFETFALPPWPPDVAAGCLRALGSTYDLDFDDHAIEAILTRLKACVPHHVEMFFGHVHHAARLKRISRITAAFAVDVYENSMLGPHGHSELSHMEERLKLVLGPDRIPLAMACLTEAAVAGCLAPDVAERIARDFFEQEWVQPLRSVLDVLEHDFYLHPSGAGYEFWSGLIADWWRRRFQLGYKPYADRG